jgi:hypothetical protein
MSDVCLTPVYWRFSAWNIMYTAVFHSVSLELHKCVYVVGYCEKDYNWFLYSSLNYMGSISAFIF